MKKHLLFLAVILFGITTAQNSKQIQTATSYDAIKEHLRPADAQQTNVATGKVTTATCTDVISYVGTTPNVYVELGGASYWDDRVKLVWQTYPSFSGNVKGVVVSASYTGTPTQLVVGIYTLSGGSPTGGFLSNVMFTPSSSTPANYTVTFPSPVSSVNGFAIGIFPSALMTNSLATDSAALFFHSTTSANPSYVNVIYQPSYTSYWTTSTLYNLYGYLGYALMRPIVDVSLNGTFVSQKTSTACGAPAVYSFTNTTTSPAAQSTLVAPSTNPYSNTLDYGDGSSVLNPFAYNASVSHTYATTGTFVATYNRTYNGWVNNCVNTATQSIVIDNPQPSFTYTLNGFTIQVTNTSQNLSTFVWNFGDLSTSTQDQPGSHTFTSPGTYVIELEGTAPCGKVRYSVSVNVTGTATGLVASAGPIQVRLYPNPASSTLHFNVSNPSAVEKAEVFNTLGQKVLSVNAPAGSIDIDALPRGTYSLRITAGAETVSKPFIKD